jgi:uncharacterized damage-inducible protein DinB
MMAGMAEYMFVKPEQDPRVDAPPRSGERETLAGFLAWYRGTLELKCSGLDAEAMARRSVEPSAMSRLGLLRHLADAELIWWRRIMAGQDAPYRFISPEEPDADFFAAEADPEMVAQAWAAWRAEAAFADEFVASAPSLDLLSVRDAGPQGQVSLRWVLTHMIEEYARHAGHADLLRERIDGAVGQ